MRCYISGGICVFLISVFPNLSLGANPNEFLGRLYTEPGTGFQLPYRLFKPISYDPLKEYPLVLFLHGAGESGTDNVAQVNSNIDNLLAHVKMSTYSSFLLAPQTNSGWFSYADNPSNSIRTTLNVIGQLENEFSIDTTHVYVTGLSMGGGGTWDIIVRRPEKFAAAVPICGYGDTSKASLLVDQPIWAFHAANDTVVSVQYTRDMINAVVAAGGNPLYTEYTTGGHGIWGQVYNDTQMYDWMFSQYTVPEPTALALWASGLIMIGCYLAWKRSRK